jgi:hypothetical protein
VSVGRPDQSWPMHEPRNDKPDSRRHLYPQQSTGASNPPSAQQRERDESDQSRISQSLSPSTLNASATESGLPDSDRAGQEAAGLYTANPGFGALPGYGFPPGGALVFDDWNSSIDFGEFSTFYQPQGELVHDLRAQQPIVNDFSIPVPVSLLNPTPPPPPPENVATVPSNNPVPSPSRRTNSIPLQLTRGHESHSATLMRTQSMADLVSSSRQQMADHSMSRNQAGGPAISTRAGMKRKADSDTPVPPSSAEPSPPKRPSMAKPSLPGQSPASRLTRSQAAVHGSDTPGEGDAQVAGEDEGTQNTESGVKKGTESGVLTKGRKIAEVPSRLTTVLPAGKVFPIQIGSELFRLSGASLSSDGQFVTHLPLERPNTDSFRAPSYFSHYFGEQLIQTGGRASQIKTLYIDRDPMTFKDIALHLQGE